MTAAIELGQVLARIDQRIAAELLRDLGYVRDEHQPRQDGKRLPRMWRRASDASDPSPPSETGQTACSTTDQWVLTQISDLFLEPSTKPGIGRSVGKTSESSETARAKLVIGSGSDAYADGEDPHWSPPGTSVLANGRPPE